MFRRLTVLTVGMLLAFVTPAFLAADQKGDKEKGEPTEQLVRLGDVVCTLTQVEGSQKYLTVQISQQVIVPNFQGGMQNNWDLLRRQHEIMRNPNPLQRRMQLMQLMAEQQRQQANAFQVRQVSTNVELQAGDDLKVRILQPPADFDDKGRPRRYTAKELKEMKGPDPKQPGYTGDFDHLKPGQTVQVSLAQRKDAFKKPVLKAKAKDVDVDAPKAAPEKEKDRPEARGRLLVTRVVILAEPPQR